MKEEIKAAIICIVIGIVLVFGNWKLARYMYKLHSAPIQTEIEMLKQGNEILKKELEELQLENTGFGIKTENEELKEYNTVKLNNVKFGVVEPLWTYNVTWKPNGTQATFVEYTRSTGEKYLYVLPWGLKYKQDQITLAEKVLPEIKRKYEKQQDIKMYNEMTF